MKPQVRIEPFVITERTAALLVHNDGDSAVIYTAALDGPCLVELEPFSIRILRPRADDSISLLPCPQGPRIKANVLFQYAQVDESDLTGDYDLEELFQLAAKSQLSVPFKPPMQRVSTLEVERCVDMFFNQAAAPNAKEDVNEPYATPVKHSASKTHEEETTTPHLEVQKFSKGVSLMQHMKNTMTRQIETAVERMRPVQTIQLVMDLETKLEALRQQVALLERPQLQLADALLWIVLLILVAVK